MLHDLQCRGLFVARKSQVHSLSEDMAKEKFWGQDDAEITKLWLEDLKNIGYREPQRVDIYKIYSQLPKEYQMAVQESKHSTDLHLTSTELQLRWAITINNRRISVSFLAIVSSIVLSIVLGNRIGSRSCTEDSDNNHPTSSFVYIQSRSTIYPTECKQKS